MTARAFSNSLIAGFIPVALALLRWKFPEKCRLIFSEIHKSSLIEAMLASNLALAALLASVVSVLLLYVQAPQFNNLRATGNDRRLLDGFNLAIYWSLAGLPLLAAASIIDNARLTYVAMCYFSIVLYQVLQCIGRLREATMIATGTSLADLIEEDPEQEGETEVPRPRSVAR